jgi:hypothetical protein
VAIREKNLYRLSTVSNYHVANVAASVDDAQLWHERLGHIGFDGLKHMSNADLVHGLPKFSSLPPSVCTGCMEGKLHRAAFPSASENRAKEPLQLVHSDICGKMRNQSIGGAWYFATFTDDFSRHTTVYFLKTKDEVFEKFKEWQRLMEKQTGKEVKVFRTDGGGEYTSKRFEAYLASCGIRHEISAPYTPQQNEVAERGNRSIVEKARSMMHARDVPINLWAEAVSTAVFLKNRSPTRALEGKTPEEAFTGEKPSVANLHVFGCKAHVHVPKEQRGKFDAKSKTCLFVG